MKPHALSRYIDDPVYFLFWPLPEAIPLITMLMLGMYISHFWMCTAIGFFITYLLRKYNSQQKPGYLLHFFYRIGLLLTTAKTLPNPYITQYH